MNLLVNVLINVNNQITYQEYIVQQLVLVIMLFQQTHNHMYAQILAVIIFKMKLDTVLMNVQMIFNM